VVKAYRDDLALIQKEVDELKRFVEILMTSVLDIGVDKVDKEELIDSVSRIVKTGETVKVSEIGSYTSR